MSVKTLLLVILMIVVFGLLALGVALAVRVDEDHDSTSRAVASAQQFWGSLPCDGNINIHYADLPSGQAGEARHQEITLPTGQKLIQNCEIAIDRRRWGQRLYCGIVVHEVGHLRGREHSNNRNSVMYPVLSERNLPHVCK